MQSLIFDLDGTLLDTSSRHKKLFHDSLNEFPELNSLNYDSILEQKYYGLSWSEILAPYLSSSKVKLFLDFIISNIEKKEYLLLDKLHVGVDSMLKELVCLDFSLILFTMRQSESNVNWQIKKLKIDTFFNKIIATKGASKATYIKNSDLGEFEFSKVYIGDTEEDLNASSLLGSRFIAVTYGMRHEKFWSEKMAENMTDTVKSLHATLINL